MGDIFLVFDKPTLCPNLIPRISKSVFCQYDFFYYMYRK